MIQVIGGGILGPAGLPLLHKIATAAGGTVLQSVQADAGITLGTTLLASGTSPPAVTLSGSPSVGTPVVYMEIESIAGVRGTAQFRYSADGGATFIETGVVTAATYAMLGACAGLTLNFANAVYSSDNRYKATVATWATQAGANDFTNGTAASQPLLVYGGLNGRKTVLADGSDDLLTSGLDLPAPGTTPFCMYTIFKIVTWVSAASIWGNNSALSAGLFMKTGGTTGQVNQVNASVQNTNGAATQGSWVRSVVQFTNTTADYVRIGATNATGGNAGNTNPTANHSLFKENTAGFGNVEMACHLVLSGTYTVAGAVISALDLAAVALYGPGVAT